MALHSRCQYLPRETNSAHALSYAGGHSVQAASVAVLKPVLSMLRRQECRMPLKQHWDAHREEQSHFGNYLAPAN